MTLEQAPTIDLLHMLIDRDARKRTWERDRGTWGSYSDSSDESMLADITDILARRIDGRARAPEPKDPLESDQ